jgi:hypothetical protein
MEDVMEERSPLCGLGPETLIRRSAPSTFVLSGSEVGGANCDCPGTENDTRPPWLLPPATPPRAAATLVAPDTQKLLRPAPCPPVTLVRPPVMLVRCPPPAPPAALPRAAPAATASISCEPRVERRCKQ